ncbi:MAG: RsmD family RNA methyltransferase [Gemmatimonadaceae bacterium]
MRIIAGRWRGRTLRAPTDGRVRPTGDRAREAWMSILQPEIPDAKVLDLFAGSGALGLEALSRGAVFADMVDVAPASLRAIRANAESLGALEQLCLHREDAIRFAQRLSPYTYDIAFADPPYRLGMALRLVEVWQHSPFARVLGIEHDAHEVLPGEGTTRTYGGTAITLYRSDPALEDLAAPAET